MKNYWNWSLVYIKWGDFAINCLSLPLEKPHAFDPRGHSGADPVKTFSSDP